MYLKEIQKIYVGNHDAKLCSRINGFFTTYETAGKHLKQSPNIRVIITAPSKDCSMYVMGVNNKDYQKEQIISNASSSKLFRHQ